MKQILAGRPKAHIAEAFGISRALVKKMAKGEVWKDAMASASQGDADGR